MAPQTPNHALPSFADCCLSDLEDGSRAYSLLVQHEARALRENPGSEPEESLLLSVRVLAQLLIAFARFRVALGRTPLDALVRAILSCFSDRQDGPSIDADCELQWDADEHARRVDALGTFYRERYLRVFRRTDPERGPQPWFPPSRPCFETVQDMMDHYLQASETSDFERGRIQALRRDGFRCVLTGHFDDLSASACREVMRMVDEDGDDACITAAECCHVLDPAFLLAPPGSDQQSDKRSPAASVGEVLDSLGLGDLRFNSAHAPANMFVLCANAHASFDSLSLWFEPTAILHQYSLGGNALVLKGLFRRPGDLVVFRDHSHLDSNAKDSQSVPLPLPDPRLMALHAACARAVHLTGAVQYFNKWDAEAELHPVLSPDGSAADLLAERLGRVLAADSARECQC